MNRLDPCPVKNNAPETGADRGRKPYTSPMLTRHGNVSALTNKARGINDGGGGAMKGPSGNG